MMNLPIKHQLILLLIAAFSFPACGQQVEETSEEICNWCGTSEAPEEVSWQTVLADESETGERIRIRGTLYHSDGKTPAEGVILYVYHTNSKGIYEVRGDETGTGTIHGHFRGWMKTDKEGKYQFESIRPGHYPTHDTEPAHIHYVLEGIGLEEHWVANVWFADDPRVNEEQLARLQRVGGHSNVVELKMTEDGVMEGVRNIILQKYE